MFAELKALVALAETGSMERAAGGLSLTPSAFSRRIQRLESELGVVLLDRHFKPPKLTQAGFEVLEKSRSILSSLGDLKTAMAGSAPPAGPFRLGLSHALARPGLCRVIIELGKRFPRLQPHIGNDTTPRLLARLHAGELDVALGVLPMDCALPRDLESVTLARESMRPVQARGSAPALARSREFYRRPWVLNPAGCLVRQELQRRVESLGVPFVVAAEVYDPDLQLALIAANVGIGMLPAGFLHRHSLRRRFRLVEGSHFDIPVRIVFLRARHLGTRGPAAAELQRLLSERLGR